MSASFMPRTRCLLAAAALLWSVPAAAQICDAAIVPTTSTLRLDYDPFAFARTVGRLTFEIEGHSDRACDVDLVLLDTMHVAIGEKEVDGTGVVVAFSAAAGEATLAGTATPGIWRTRIEPGHRTRVSINGIVSQDAVAAAGEHAADLTIELRNIGSLAAQGLAMPIRVVLAAVPRAQMNIVGAAATFGQGTSIAQVDFGVFESNAHRRVFLQVRANSRARLTIGSANLGRLMLADGPEQERGIAYSAQFMEQPVDLTHRWETFIDPPHSLAGTSLPLDMMLGAVDAHVAGSYSDILTIEISTI